MPSGKRKVHAALLKRSVQTACFLLFILLLVEAASGPEALLDPGLLQQCDPLNAAGVLVTGRSLVLGILPGLFVILATIVFGRIFCGYVCPLGATIDAAGKLLTPKKRRPFLGRLRRLKEALLVAVLAAAVGGFALYSLLSPLPLLGRALSYLVLPGLTGLADLGLDALRPTAEDLGYLELARTTLDTPSVATGPTVLIILLVVLALVLVAPRLWCRALCPAGGLLGLCASRAVFRRVVDESCDGCGACARLCPMGAIPLDAPHTTDRRECTLCRTCAAICPRGSISFRFSSTGSRAALGEEVRCHRSAPAAALSRRKFISMAGGGAALGAASAVVALPQSPGRLIRPPGALPEPLFSATCVRCGLCIQACPTHTLRPSGLEEGLAGLWTPRLDTREGPCDPHCRSCGVVCPSHAIRELPLPEKTNAKIGTAIIERERCLAWNEDQHCMVCDEVCPINAIEVRPPGPGRSVQTPVVIPERCNGCGACEHACPVEGISAIRITPEDEIRLAEGSYIEEGKRRGLVFEARETEDVYGLPGNAENAYGLPQGDGGGPDGLPPGFTTD